MRVRPSSPHLALPFIAPLLFSSFSVPSHYFITCLYYLNPHYLFFPHYFLHITSQPTVSGLSSISPILLPHLPSASFINLYSLFSINDLSSIPIHTSNTFLSLFSFLFDFLAPPGRFALPPAFIYTYKPPFPWTKEKIPHPRHTSVNRAFATAQRAVTTDDEAFYFQNIVVFISALN